MSGYIKLISNFKFKEKNLEDKILNNENIINLKEKEILSMKLEQENNIKQIKENHSTIQNLSKICKDNESQIMILKIDIENLKNENDIKIVKINNEYKNEMEILKNENEFNLKTLKSERESLEIENKKFFLEEQNLIQEKNIKLEIGW